jgi:hypothetical protein
VTRKVEKLSAVLSDLLALYRVPANAAAFERNEAALSTLLTKHQLCFARRFAAPPTKVPEPTR